MLAGRALAERRQRRTLAQPREVLRQALEQRLRAGLHVLVGQRLESIAAVVERQVERLDALAQRLRDPLEDTQLAFYAALLVL